MFDNQSVLNQYDAIVIGSGISGLTISLILAKEGKKVALLEQDRDIAPLIRPYRRKDCECSPGLHAIGWMNKGETISSFLKYLNIHDGVEERLDEDGFGHIIVGTNKYHFPKGFDNVEKALLSYFPECPEAVCNYIKQIKEVNEQTFYLNHRLFSEGRNRHSLGGADNYTLHDYLCRYHASQGLIELLGLFNYILMGSKAEEVPFNIHAFVIGGYYQSPGYFTLNGINKLLSNFKRELIKYGVHLFTNSEVSEIVVDNQRTVMGVKVQNSFPIYAPDVIVSFNPKLLNDKLKENTLRPIYRRRLQEAENTFSLYVAFYKINEDNGFKIENFIYSNDNLDFALGATVNYSGSHRTLSVFLTDHILSIPEDGEERKERAQKNLKLLEGVLYDKIPNLKGKLILLDYLKPWSFECYTKAFNGSAYSIKHTVNLFGFQHRVPIHGLYLVGQAIYPGFLGSMVSGFSLAYQLLETKQFWQKVTNE